MRAARYYNNHDIRVEDVPMPSVGPNQCLIKVEWCGICGTDMHENSAGENLTLKSIRYYRAPDFRQQGP